MVATKTGALGSTACRSNLGIIDTREDEAAVCRGSMAVADIFGHVRVWVSFLEESTYSL
jgi:hypothetical protein